MTFRFNGHVFGDPGGYIPREEMAAAKKADPVPLLRQHLLDSGVEESILDEIDAEIEVEVEEAAKFALESGDPDMRENQIDVYDYEVSA